MIFMPPFSACVLFYSERTLGPIGEHNTVDPLRVTRRSHDLPSHVLVIASLLVSGARCVFVLPPPGPLHVFPFKYVLV